MRKKSGISERHQRVWPPSVRHSTQFPNKQSKSNHTNNYQYLTTVLKISEVGVQNLALCLIYRRPDRFFLFGEVDQELWLFIVLFLWVCLEKAVRGQGNCPDIFSFVSFSLVGFAVETPSFLLSLFIRNLFLFTIFGWKNEYHWNSGLSLISLER